MIKISENREHVIPPVTLLIPMPEGAALPKRNPKIDWGMSVVELFYEELRKLDDLKYPERERRHPQPVETSDESADPKAS